MRDKRTILDEEEESGSSVTRESLKLEVMIDIRDQIAKLIDLLPTLTIKE